MRNKEKKEVEQEQDIENQKKKSKIKMIICLVILIIVIVACCVAFYVFTVNSNYFKTDNAKVTAKMYNVVPVTAGKLISWDVDTGDLVEKDQILGRQEVLPYITAPISGTVVKNDGAVNQVVAAGSPIAVIADTADLYIGVNVEETDIAKIKVGQKVDVNIDAFPHKTLEGQVTEIDPTTQTYFSGASSFSTSGTYTKVTQLIPIKVSLKNDENLPLTFGMNATVKIHLK